jgi:hypothetical protein
VADLRVRSSRASHPSRRALDACPTRTPAPCAAPAGRITAPHPADSHNCPSSATPFSRRSRTRACVRATRGGSRRCGRPRSERALLARGALLSQDAIARRIRLRPCLGRRLYAGRGPLLPKAPGQRALHARSPARGCSFRTRPTRRRPRGAGARTEGVAGAGRRVLDPSHLPAQARLGGAWRPGLAAAHRPAVPLAERGLRHLRGLSHRARLAQAQGDPARAPRRAEPRRSPSTS